MRQAKTFTKIEALVVMEEAGGHAYLWPDVGTAIGAAFGLDLSPERKRNAPNEFKGLSVPGIRDGEVVEGYSVYNLSERIADSLPDPLPRVYLSQEGRGSRARSACETIRAHLTRTGEDKPQGAAPGLSASPEAEEAPGR